MNVRAWLKILKNQKAKRLMVATVKTGVPPEICMCGQMGTIVNFLVAH